MTSHDILPMSGKSTDAGTLEGLGKQAAALHERASITMTEAVVQTIGRAKLSSEQVRRVVEFANIEMFNRKYAAMAGSFRTVHVDDGPADPAAVLQDLNDIARPQEVIVDALEYSMPPDLGKTAGLMDIPEARPRGAVMAEIYALHSKVSAAHDELIQSVEASKERVAELFVDLVDAVKSASAGGAAPEEILAAWMKINPEAAKVAYARARPFMRANTKVAGRYLNPAAEVVDVFAKLVKESQSCQRHTLALKNVEAELVKINQWFRSNGG